MTAPPVAEAIHRDLAVASSVNWGDFRTPQLIRVVAVSNYTNLLMTSQASSTVRPACHYDYRPTHIGNLKVLADLILCTVWHIPLTLLTTSPKEATQFF